MGLSQAQVHFEDVQSTFGIREVNLSGCAGSVLDLRLRCANIYDTTLQESAGFRSVVVPAPLDQIDPAEAGLHREPAEEISRSLLEVQHLEIENQGTPKHSSIITGWDPLIEEYVYIYGYKIRSHDMNYIICVIDYNCILKN